MSKWDMPEGSAQILRRTVEGMDWRHFNMNSYANVEDCGTVLCLAGKICVNHGCELHDTNGTGLDLEFYKDGEEIEPESFAAGILGLDKDQTFPLFHESQWPWRFSLNSRRNPKHLDILADRVEYFIKTGK